MKNKRPVTFYLFLLAILLVSLVTPACVQITSPSIQATPVAAITTPQNGSRFPVGEPVVVQFSAADVQGVGQVELIIDGQPVRVETVDPPVNSFVANYVWTPDSTGSHAIELRAFNVAGDSSEPVKVFVTISEPLIGSAATPGTDSPVQSPVPDTPTALPADITPAPTSQELPPTPTAAGQAPISGSTATALVGLNVRSGPGLGYPVIGRLVAGQAVPVTGRNPQGSWWQVAFPPESGQRGWISGGAQYSTVVNVEGVPVVEAPPLPTPAAPPTDTPAPFKPTIHSFTADRYTITRGERVVLRWDLSNAQAAYLRYDDREEGVVSPGEKTVTPDEDTVYRLIARNDAGETTAEVSIRVTGTSGTPVPVYREGTMRIVPDQTVDFDDGVIQQGRNNPGADFYWDAPQRKFVAQAGSSGTLTSRSFDDITFEECRSANYDQPIPEINPNNRISGCYRTNEGRYGKYWVSEWDISGNLTIIWQTWDYR